MLVYIIVNAFRTLCHCKWHHLLREQGLHLYRKGVRNKLVWSIGFNLSWSHTNYGLIRRLQRPWLSLRIC